MELRAQLSPWDRHPQLPWHSGHGLRPGFWKRATEWLKYETNGQRALIVAGFAKCQQLLSTRRARLLAATKESWDLWIWVHEVGSGSEIIFGIGEQIFRHVWWDLDADTALLNWHGTPARCQKWNKKSAGSAALGNVQAPAWSHCFSYKLLIFFYSWCDI